MDPHDVILAPVQSERSFQGLEHQRYTFKVHPSADKVQIREAVQVAFGVTVTSVNTATTKAKPKRRGAFVGTRAGYKKAIITLKAGDSIQIFEGVH